MKSKTTSILAGVRVALATAAADRGGSAAPVDHPLAGTAEPRPRFVRAADGSDVLATGEALKVGDLAWVDIADQPRVVRGDDLFVGGASPDLCELPLLYALPRARIGILGASLPTISCVRRLPKPGTGYDDPAVPGVLAAPYDGTRYPDRQFLSRPELPPGQTLETASSEALDYALAQTRAELLQLGAIKVADPALPLIKGERVRQGEAGESPKWRPGDVLDGSTWRAYRLRGAAVYDAWGREILYSLGDNDAVRLESAGPDGVFRWHPGGDGVFQTAVDADSPADDDRDGTLDNIGAKSRD